MVLTTTPPVATKALNVPYAPLALVLEIDLSRLLELILDVLLPRLILMMMRPLLVEIMVVAVPLVHVGGV